MRLIHVNIGVQLCERLAAVGLILLGVTAVRLHAFAIRARVRGVHVRVRMHVHVHVRVGSVCARARHAGLHGCTLALQIIRFMEEVKTVVHATPPHTHTHRNIHISTTHTALVPTVKNLMSEL